MGATRRRRGRVAAFLLVSVLLIPLGLFAGTLVPRLRTSSCDVLAYTRLDHISRPCAGMIAARLPLAAGHNAFRNHQYRVALNEYRTAAATAPDALWAHLSHGMTAEALGEYHEALDAYARAARLSGSLEARMREAGLAARIGKTDRAIEILERAQFGWFTTASAGLFASGGAAVVCIVRSLSSPAEIVGCPSLIRRVAGTSMDYTRQAIPQALFGIIFDTGDHDRAIAFAHRQGWVLPEHGWCAARNQSVLGGETLAMLALVMDGKRADCAMPVAAGLANDGLARRARVMLVDRAKHSPDPTAREAAQKFLRYRLPDHDVPVIAETLNVTGSTLLNQLHQPDEAVATLKKAVDADPRFSWPYHNLAIAYMKRNDHRTARGWLEKALAVNPDHWRAMLNYGATLANLGAYQEALVVYRRAAAITPNDAQLHASIGWTLERLGHTTDAEREMRTALQLDPDQKDAREYLNARYGRDSRRGPTPGTAR